MSHWTFVIAAYAISLAATGALTWWSYAAMRSAESEADALRRER